MNINDLENLKVIKNTIGNYIGGDAGGPFGPPIRSIWGLPVVGTPVMPANQFLVGAFYDGAQIFDRMGATLMISTENEDDFIRNLATFLVEERLAMTVRRPQAFIFGAFPERVADALSDSAAQNGARFWCLRPRAFISGLARSHADFERSRLDTEAVTIASSSGRTPPQGRTHRIPRVYRRDRSRP
jgi:hypothetical protein